MRQLIECVPNISEGRDSGIIKLMEAAISKYNVALLDTYSGASTNRSVFTFVGEPSEVKQAAISLVEATAKHIDMRQHSGTHPRIGGCDVLPFVPFHNTTLEDCTEIARSVGASIAEQVHVPVYLYGAAATSEKRRRLPYLRRGEYESLVSRLGESELQPDFGTLENCAITGATAVGSRFFLLAFNINLETRDLEIAKQIAYCLRESGPPKGTALTFPALTLPQCHAIGWLVPEFGCAQVSTNLTDFRVTSMHRVFEEAKKLAEKLGTRVTGSELVGLVPESAMQQSGAFYLKDSAQPGDPVAAAIGALGLAHEKPFNPNTRILERRLASVRPDLLH